MSVWQHLSKAFPRGDIHWRSQNIAVNDNGAKALALAYLDARDVMGRLDDVVGPENWQDSYVETPKGRLICQLSIRVGGEWITKSDGAGDTAVEGEKGAMSDAFKRAAVKFGIGRYLYALGSVWAECEHRTDSKGKHYWKKWKPSTVALFDNALAQVEPNFPLSKDDMALIDAIQACNTADELMQWKAQSGEVAGQSINAESIRKAFNERRGQINNQQKKAA